MKICLVNQPIGVIQFPCPGSAISIWTYEVARRLAKGHKVVVFTRKGKNQANFEHHEGVEYRRIHLKSDELILRMLRLLPRGARSHRPIFDCGLYYLGYISRIARQVRELGCDVVHLISNSQYVPILRALNPGIKIVLHMHGLWLTQLPAKLVRERLAQTDLVVGCSDYLTDSISRRFRGSCPPCRTVYNGVDVEQFSPASDRAAKPRATRNLLFVGRISPEKGLHHLLDAFAIVLKSNPDVHLTLIGPEWVLPAEFLAELSDEPGVRDLRRFYGRQSYPAYLRSRLDSALAGRVTFAGMVKHPQLVDYYRNADAVILPSLSETFGVSLIEAMSCGVPVIASAVGGMRELVQHETTGLLAPPGDPKALAEAILRLLKDPALAAALARAGRQRAQETFSWDQIAGNMLRQYQIMWEQHGNSGSNPRHPN